MPMLLDVERNYGRLKVRLLQINSSKFPKNTSISQVDSLSADIKKTDQCGLQSNFKIGEFSRGGLTRGNNIALDHDFPNSPEARNHTPCGIVDEDTGELFINIGSSFKTSDFIVDSLQLWWRNLSRKVKSSIEEIQIKPKLGDSFFSGTK